MRAGKFFVSLGFSAIAFAGAGLAQDAQLPAGPGKDAVVTACTTCHAMTQVTSQRHTKEQWATTVDTMISRGAAVSDEDYAKVVEYLAAHFGPTAAAVPAAAAPASAAQPRAIPQAAPNGGSTDSGGNMGVSASGGNKGLSVPASSISASQQAGAARPAASKAPRCTRTVKRRCVAWAPKAKR